MFRSLLIFTLIFSMESLHAQDLSAQVCPVQTTSLRITQPKEDVIRFEVCRNGSCRPLGKAPGFYRLSDIRSQRVDLRKRLQANHLNDKIRKSFIKIGSVTLGLLGLTIVSMCAVVLVPSHHDVLLNTTIGLLTISSVGAALMPYASHLWHIHQGYKQEDRTLGKAMMFERRPMSEAQLIAFIEDLDHALKFVPSLSECEVDLSPNPIVQGESHVPPEN